MPDEAVPANGAIEHWACDRAQAIMLEEGFLLIRSARNGTPDELREISLRMARVIATSLVEASEGLQARQAGE